MTAGRGCSATLSAGGTRRVEDGWGDGWIHCVEVFVHTFTFPQSTKKTPLIKTVQTLDEQSALATSSRLPLSQHADGLIRLPRGLAVNS